MFAAVWTRRAGCLALQATGAAGGKM